MHTKLLAYTQLFFDILLYSHHSLFPSLGLSFSLFQSSHYLVALPGLQVRLWGVELAQVTV